MLLALYTIFVLGGGGAFGPMLFIDDAIDKTKTVIVEKERQKEITATLKSMNKRSKEYTSAMKKTIKGLDADSNPHEKSAPEIEAFWVKVFELNSQFSSDFVDKRFELREQLDRDEWEAIFPAEG